MSQELKLQCGVFQAASVHDIQSFSRYIPAHPANGVDMNGSRLTNARPIARRSTSRRCAGGNICSKARAAATLLASGCALLERMAPGRASRALMRKSETCFRNRALAQIRDVAMACADGSGRLIGSPAAAQIPVLIKANTPDFRSTAEPGILEAGSRLASHRVPSRPTGLASRRVRLCVRPLAPALRRRPVTLVRLAVVQ